MTFENATFPFFFKITQKPEDLGPTCKRPAKVSNRTVEIFPHSTIFLSPMVSKILIHAFSILMALRDFALHLSVLLLFFFEGVLFRAFCRNFYRLQRSETNSIGGTIQAEAGRSTNSFPTRLTEFPRGSFLCAPIITQAKFRSSIAGPTVPVIRAGRTVASVEPNSGW